MDSFSHLPVLINALGHIAGAAAFGAFLALLGRSALRQPSSDMVAPTVAATLALLWNLGSLAGLMLEPTSATAHWIEAGSFAVLSLLPSVLLQLALGRDHAWLARAGYVTSAAAALSHIMEPVGATIDSHSKGLAIITYGFGALTILAAALLARRPIQGRQAGMRALAAISLFLLAASFTHFDAAHGPASWSHELFIHHAGIPLALFVLLQDYRFLLLDVFVRLLGAGILAAGLASGLGAAAQLLGLLRIEENEAGPAIVLLLLATVAILAYPRIRELLRGWIQAVLFRRGDLQQAIERLRELSGESEDNLLEQTAEQLARFVRAKRWRVAADYDGSDRLVRPGLIEPRPASADRWAEAAVPFQLGGDRFRLLLLGPREGGRRYLSEDLQDLEALGAEVVSHLDRYRQDEQRRLLAEAELVALRAQINPHFLFNSLNALYGLIPRAAADARRLLVNLADIFRYLLQGQEQFVTVEQELRVVEAYLEIERVRLGPRLTTSIHLDVKARSFKAPALSIQPLVENAVKHGLSPKAAGGSVVVRAEANNGSLVIEVADDGVGFHQEGPPPAGHGLRNVRRRLDLCYGDRASFNVSSSPAGTRAVIEIQTDGS